MKRTPKPFNTGYLPGKEGHEVCFYEYGNSKGIPIVSFHGGPGSKAKPKHAAKFDLEQYHVITFDQRGCGQSKAKDLLSSNTTADLVEDIERLRNYLKIDKWFVSGSSWGSTLALAYAQQHPDYVRGMLLGSVFLARERDLDWATVRADGVDQLFPDLHEHHLAFLKKHEASPQTAAADILKVLTTASKEETKQIVAGVASWEGNLMNALEDIQLIEPEEIEESDIAEVKIYMHYEANNFFLEPNQLLNNMPAIKDIPAIIVHGRYDVLCPAEQAWKVHQGLSNSEIIILPTSNHRLTAEGDIAKELAYKYFLSQNS